MCYLSTSSDAKHTSEDFFKRQAFLCPLAHFISNYKLEKIDTLEIPHTLEGSDSHSEGKFPFLYKTELLSKYI